MAFENVGAYVNGVRPTTKKALREALTATDTVVVFDATSPFSSRDRYQPSTIPPGLKLSVVGPDPYTKRSWYATVSNVNGKITIS